MSDPQTPSKAFTPWHRYSEAELLSAFIDDDLTASEARLVAAQLSSDPEQQATALRYWMTSDVLSSLHAPDHRPDLCAKIAARIAQEPVYMPQAARLAGVGHNRKPITPALRLVASVAAVAFVGAGAFFTLSLPTGSGDQALVASSERSSVSAAAPVQSVGSGSPSGSLMLTSFDSPEGRALLDAHGASHVRLRMDDR
ncbi:MAG: Anti sigma-E protein RseA, N-terminal domain [Pseudomonadota bacterium]|jgi:negative regulator of sigma E activity